jgi:hypothetical protein
VATVPNLLGRLPKDDPGVNLAAAAYAMNAALIPGKQLSMLALTNGNVVVDQVNKITIHISPKWSLIVMCYYRC